MANVASRSVALNAGRHVVEMRYRPAAALVGLALSGLSLLGLAVVAAIARQRRRFGHEAPP